MSLRNYSARILLALASFVIQGDRASAQAKYDVGATDTEIKIGNLMPYSGPASAFASVGKTIDAYFKKVNAEGGINGRKITFVSYDDAYSPPKAVEQVRRLVESDEVLSIFQPLGTPSNSAIQKYLNQRHVPQIFAASGASRFNDPKNFPWTMGWQPSYQMEAQVYSQYVLAERPGAKIAVLYQNDDFGKDFLKGLKSALGEQASKLIVAEESYEVAEPTIESHVVKLKSTGADVFFDITTPKFAAQAIKKSAEIGWTPLHFVSNISSSISGVLRPAGLDNAQGIISGNYAKDPLDPQWTEDAGLKRFYTFLDQYLPAADKFDASVLYGYNSAQAMVYVLKQAGNDLTRKNVMEQAASIKDLELDGLLPGIKVNTSATDFGPLKQLQVMRFKDDRWVLFGPIRGAQATN